jgi:hypothetical protein
MMQIDHHFHEHLTPDKIDHILERVAVEPSPHEGHQPPGEPSDGSRPR